jgi:hypothetical protein
MARADELRRISPRRVRVRIVTRHGDLDPGVIIVANIAAKTGPELEAQLGKGIRYVPLAELDARAHELPGLVDEAAAEVEALVAAAPEPLARPSLRKDDFDANAYESVVQGAYRAMMDAVRPVFETSASSLSSGGAHEAVALAALQVTSVVGLAGKIELNDLIEMLELEFKEKRDQIGGTRGPTEKHH